MLSLVSRDFTLFSSVVQPLFENTFIALRSRILRLTRAFPPFAGSSAYHAVILRLRYNKRVSPAFTAYLFMNPLFLRLAS